MEALLLLAVAGAVLYAAVWAFTELCTRLDSAGSADEDEAAQR
jgi:hypothetical protein